MKSKLTVTIEEDLIPAAKRIARKRGVSLSSIIEQSFRELTEDGTDFVAHWRGRFVLGDAEEARFVYLKEKYLADPD